MTAGSHALTGWESPAIRKRSLRCCAPCERREAIWEASTITPELLRRSLAAPYLIRDLCPRASLLVACLGARVTADLRGPAPGSALVQTRPWHRTRTRPDSSK